METIYRAYDGTTFKNKEECEKYEEHQNKIKSEIHIFDENFEELSFDNPHWADTFYFFKCETEESFNTFLEDFPGSVIYDDSEKLDLFFANPNSDLFMTIRYYEESTVSKNYLTAKEFQEKLIKGE